MIKDKSTSSGHTSKYWDGNGVWQIHTICWKDSHLYMAYRLCQKFSCGSIHNTLKYSYSTLLIQRYHHCHITSQKQAAKIKRWNNTRGSAGISCCKYSPWHSRNKQSMLDAQISMFGNCYMHMVPFRWGKDWIWVSRNDNLNIVISWSTPCKNICIYFLTFCGQMNQKTFHDFNTQILQEARQKGTIPVISLRSHQSLFCQQCKFYCNLQ